MSTQDKNINIIKDGAYYLGLEWKHFENFCNKKQL